jgi:hypothetical protein
MSDRRNLQGALQGMHRRRVFAEAAHGGLMEHEFRVQVFGAGRLRPMTFYFDVAFTEAPDMQSSVHLLEGDAIMYRPPTVSRIAIASWVRSETGLYMGAVVETTVSGYRRQRISLNLLFSGEGLELPLTKAISDTTTNDTI